MSSTGIYCRPICRAKLPKAENCSFYDTAAAAERAGFRPCLLCRPELAPAPLRWTPRLPSRGEPRGCSKKAAGANSASGDRNRLGCTDRHLRRAFAAEYNVTPIQYLQTCKLLLAKNLLTDTDLSVIGVAMAAGFGSLRRFNDLFKKQYRLAPTALRKRGEKRQGAKRRRNPGVGISSALPLGKDARFPGTSRHPRSGSGQGRGIFADGPARDRREDGQALGWVRIGHKPENHVLTVTVDSALLPALPQVLGRVRHVCSICTATRTWCTRFSSR